LKVDHLSRPVRYVWVCPSGHVGPPGRKRRRTDDTVRPCFECGEDARLLPVSPSGKTRRRKKLPDTLVRPEEEFEEERGPQIEPEPFPDGFDLTDRQRDAFDEGEVPTIAFPLTGMPPLQAGRLYEATDDLDIYVLGYRETTTHLVARFDVHRAEQLVREDAVHVEREATKVPAWRDAKNGDYHPAQPEAERVTKKEVSQMTIEVLESNLEKQKKDVEKADALVKALERDYSRDQCWGARKTVDSLEAVVEATEERIRALQKGLRRTVSAPSR
jgi:hypothetical protein